MMVIYERSGGFAGMMQSLRVEDGTLRLNDKGRLLVERPLLDEELQHLEGLVGKARSADPPIESMDAANDPEAYSVLVRFDDEAEPRVGISTLTLPANGTGPEWDELLNWLDRTMTAEIRAYRDAQPKILSPRDRHDDVER